MTLVKTTGHRAGPLCAGKGIACELGYCDAEQPSRLEMKADRERSAEILVRVSQREFVGELASPQRRLPAAESYVDEAASSALLVANPHGSVRALTPDRRVLEREAHHGLAEASERVHQGVANEAP